MWASRLRCEERLEKSCRTEKLDDGRFLFALRGFLPGFATSFFLGQAFLLSFLRVEDVGSLLSAGYVRCLLEFDGDAAKFFFAEDVVAGAKPPFDEGAQVVCAFDDGEILRAFGDLLKFCLG